MTELQTELRAMIVDVLHLEDLTPEEINVDQDLFTDEGLALDSIDALELGVAIQKKYQVKLDSQDSELKQHFRSVATLAAFIEARQHAGAAP